MCYFLLVLSRGSRLKIEEGRLEVGIYFSFTFGSYRLEEL